MSALEGEDRRAKISADLGAFAALTAWREIAKGVAGVNEFIIEGVSETPTLLVVYAIIAASARETRAPAI